MGIASKAVEFGHGTEDLEGIAKTLEQNGYTSERIEEIADSYPNRRDPNPALDEQHQSTFKELQEMRREDDGAKTIYAATGLRDDMDAAILRDVRELGKASQDDASVTDIECVAGREGKSVEEYLLDTAREVMDDKYSGENEKYRPQAAGLSLYYVDEKLDACAEHHGVSREEYDEDGKAFLREALGDEWGVAAERDRASEFRDLAGRDKENQKDDDPKSDLGGMMERFKAYMEQGGVDDLESVKGPFAAMLGMNAVAQASKGMVDAGESTRREPVEQGVVESVATRDELSR